MSEDSTDQLSNGKATPSHGGFDFQKLRLPQDFKAMANVERKVIAIPVRKPAKEWFVRTHPQKDYHIPMYVLELKEEQEFYPITNDLWESLATEATVGIRLLVPTMTRDNTLFIWPARVCKPDERIDGWAESTLDAIQRAQRKWVRVVADKGLQRYVVREALSLSDEPRWPDLTREELFELAFRNRVISTEDHPVLRRLRGEI